MDHRSGKVLAYVLGARKDEGFVERKLEIDEEDLEQIIKMHLFGRCAKIPFKEKDWPVGSGEVESAHRYVPQERLKIAGACWHPETVNPMLALRVVRANGWWDAFWQWLHVQRAQQRAA